MAVDTSIVGKSTGAYKVRVERGPVSFFAAALHDELGVAPSDETTRLFHALT